MRKKVDDRIRTIIENGVELRHRSMFVTFEDKPRDQVEMAPHSISVDEDLNEATREVVVSTLKFLD